MWFYNKCLFGLPDPPPRERSGLREVEPRACIGGLAAPRPGQGLFPVPDATPTRDLSVTQRGRDGSLSTLCRPLSLYYRRAVPLHELRTGGGGTLFRPGPFAHKMAFASKIARDRADTGFPRRCSAFAV